MNKSPQKSIAALLSKWLALSFLIASVDASSGQTLQLNVAQMSRDQVTGTAPTALTSTTGTENGEIVASPNDSDLGEQQILRKTETYQPFVASVAVPFYWTSNVALTNA